MKQPLSLFLIAILSVGVVTAALHAGGDQRASYNVRILPLPDHGKGSR